jgi:DNA recombination protein RmuC
MIETLIIVLLAVLVIDIVFRLISSRNNKDSAGDNSLLMIQNQLNELNKTIDKKISETSARVDKSIQTQLNESHKLVREVTIGLTKLDETNKQVVSFTDQLQSLQDILQNPKQRGILGEYYLETVLKNVLPPSKFQMQYRFENGEAVDAVIFLDKDKILPIDSKFSLENYNRILSSKAKEEREKIEKLFRQDLKNRIDETSKYIRPRENTMDFAFMFIPSEAIYYDLLINEVGSVKSVTRDLIEYAFQKKVIIVSPTSFTAYLQTVVQGLRSLQIEEQAKEIQKRVGDLSRHIQTFDDFLKKLGNSLSTTVNHYNRAQGEFRKMDKDILRISGESADIVELDVESPKKE